MKRCVMHFDGPTLKIAFDFDMTIANTKQGVVKCLKRTLRQFDIPSIENIDEIYLQIRGLGLEEILRLVTPRSTSTMDLGEMQRYFHEIYPVVGITGTFLFPDVKKLFHYLEERNSKIVILSAKASPNLSLSMRELNIDHYPHFGGLTSADKRMFLQRECFSVYVGDTFTDIQIARDTSCKSILMNTLDESISNWEYQPDLVFRGISNFLDWIRTKGNFESLITHQGTT
jgi:phosphoglycolate phosphatase-like HAD superfamily hydrolase